MPVCVPATISEIQMPTTSEKNILDFLKKLLAFSGPAYLVAVGYMDPGNWATDLAAGSRFGYALLCVVLLASLSAILLQYLSAKLGIASGKNLAENCKTYFPKPLNFLLWLSAEIMIIACDLAEVIGSTIALQLLFRIPLPVGVFITAADVFLLLFLQSKNMRYLEAVVISLIVLIFTCFGIEMLLATPPISAIFSGLIPHRELLFNPTMLYLSIGILGATVMPHNLYLHSAVVKNRAVNPTELQKKEAVRFAAYDSIIALGLAFLVNAAILILSAKVFFAAGYTSVAEISQAHKLLSVLLGTSFASILFAVALLASGQNSALTGTLAGQIIMEGFLNIRMKPWARRLLTRSLAVLPAAAIIIYYGETGLGKLLIFSQVVLSMQLAFAVVPLVLFTSRKKIMGALVNSKCMLAAASVITVLICSANIWLIVQTF